MRKKYTGCLLISLIFSVLSGCASENSLPVEQNNSKASSGYIDIDEASRHIESVELDLTVDNFKADTKAFGVGTTKATVDDRCLYKNLIIDGKMTNVRIDLSSGRVSTICRNSGCAHRWDSQGCMNFYQFGVETATTEGIYFALNNRLMLYKDGKISEVYKNTFASDNSKEKKIDGNVIQAAYPSGDNMYLVGYDFYIPYDTVNKKAGEAKVISDSMIWTFCASEDHLYYSNMDDELFEYDINSGDRKKLGDKISAVRVYKDDLYYVQYDAGVPYLWRYESGTGKTERIISDCWVNCVIKDDHVYYNHFSSDKGFYIYDLKNKVEKSVDLTYEGVREGKRYKYLYSENNKENSEDAETVLVDCRDILFDIDTADHIDGIFATDNNNGIIFIFKPDSDEYKVIDVLKGLGL